VRDALLGKDPKDYDIATSARPEAVQKLFRRTRSVGRQFGVILVGVERRQFEVATFRTESGYTDGRHPDRVEFADARADAVRRDFTINALFYDPVRDVVHDWVGGEADLRNRILRTVGDPALRFGEDHLRLLRAVRFAARLGFSVEPGTFEAIQARADLIRSVSPERIRDELIKIFSPPHAGLGLDLLRDSGLLARVIPDLLPTITCEQTPDFHPEGSVYNHIRLMLSYLPQDASPDLAWSVLMHDIAKPLTAQRAPDGSRVTFHGHERLGEDIARRVLSALKFPKRNVEAVATAVRYHMQFKDVPQMRRSTVRRMLMRPTFDLELELHRLDCLGSHGQLDIHATLLRHREDFEAQPALHPTLLSGEHLMAIGFKPGPFLGEVLAEIRERQLQEELRTRGEAMDWARIRLAQAERSPKPD
jgi:poly(A) polymerase